MRRLAMILSVLGAMSGSARADAAAVQAVIAAQIAAFRADDAAGAFSHASPAIRDIFRTPVNFARMVQQGYPMVWRPAEVRFLSAEVIAGRLVQPVLVRDSAGALHVLDYEMIAGPDGWKINAVHLRRPAPGTV